MLKICILNNNYLRILLKIRQNSDYFTQKN